MQRNGTHSLTLRPKTSFGSTDLLLYDERHLGIELHCDKYSPETMLPLRLNALDSNRFNRDVIVAVLSQNNFKWRKEMDGALGLGLLGTLHHLFHNGMAHTRRQR